MCLSDCIYQLWLCRLKLLIEVLIRLLIVFIIHILVNVILIISPFITGGSLRCDLTDHPLMRPFVRPSVRPSVRHTGRVPYKTVEVKIVKFLPYGSPSLWFLCGSVIPPRGGVK